MVKVLNVTINVFVSTLKSTQCIQNQIPPSQSSCRRTGNNGLAISLGTEQLLTVIAGDSSECAGNPVLCVANRPGLGLSALKPKQIKVIKYSVMT